MATKNEKRQSERTALSSNGNSGMSERRFSQYTPYKPRSTSVEFLAEVEKIALGIAAMTSDLEICAKHFEIAIKCRARIVELENE